MSLSQDDRISISKKILDIPKEDAGSLDNKAKLEVVRVKAQAADDANKSLMDGKTLFINAYQKELGRQDGNDRLEVVEQDVIDSAQNKLGNFFSPNTISTPTPSNPDGIWKNFIPFSGNKAIGKTYLEVYGTTVKEGDKITAVNGFITTMEGFSAIQRSTGQSCGASGTCDLPIYTTETTCEAATPIPGVWTPGPDLIADDPMVHAAAADLVTAVTDWKTFIQATLPFVVATDPNPTKQAENNAAIADINNTISIINTWLALPDFDTAHGQTTCVGFNSYNVNLLNPTKFRAAELQAIKDEITARLAFITTRISQINANLGTVVQDMTTGTLTTTTGLYGSRMNILNLRLNLINGSLRKLEGIKLGKKAQDEAIASNVSATSVYTEVLLVSAFVAPSIGTPVINIKDSTGFALFDAVYVMSDTQQEIATTIIGINGNTVTLGVVIPAKYRQNENARIYKTL